MRHSPLNTLAKDGVQKFDDGGGVSPGAAAYFASVPDGAARMAAAQAIIAQANAMMPGASAPAASAPSGLSVSGGGSSYGPYPSASASQSSAAGSGGSRANEVQAAYLAALGRGADPAGLAYYTTGEGSRLSASDLASALAGSPEGVANALALASYTGGGGGLGGRSTTEIITQLYQDQLGRAPDAAGLREYSNALNSGQKTIAQIAN